MTHKVSRRAFLRTLSAGAALTLGLSWSGWAQSDRVRIAIIPGSSGFSDVYTGVTQGFFADHGLDVELVSFLNGSLANNALATGEVDFAPLPGGYVPFVRPAGLPYKLIAARTRKNGFSLVSNLPPGEAEPLAPLRGGAVAVEALGSTITWAVAVNYLVQAGLAPQDDVSLVAVGGRAAAAAAVETGQAAATVVDGPLDVQLTRSDGVARLIDPLEAEQHARWLGNEAELALAWITREDVIANRPETVQALVNAADASLSFLNEAADDVEGIVPELAPFFEGVPQGVLAESLARYVATLAPGVTISRALYEADLNKWVALELVQPVSFEQAVEGRFAGTTD